MVVGLRTCIRRVNTFGTRTIPAYLSLTVLWVPALLAAGVAYPDVWDGMTVLAWSAHAHKNNVHYRSVYHLHHKPRRGRQFAGRPCFVTAYSSPNGRTGFVLSRDWMNVSTNVSEADKNCHWLICFFSTNYQDNVNTCTLVHNFFFNWSIQNVFTWGREES